ncbi:glycosyltransferase family 92 protein [uncultured Alteromonas sp.]|jgi:hypothetical protein|uniref:glycosyltransferase family 92 protein n=1 Tax=uncultured Alteromonas sp. TaxID=179113 RepID=UPI0030EDA658|tara:strand:+ start:9464 stop:10696 length:1233 start_codon:yes stop_codon:yes gene_type:complete
MINASFLSKVGKSSVRSADDIRVKLVAIAKDEGAYFTQWVHHHLFFGFDDIEIFINRTTDNSSEVLDDISRSYPSVTWDSADWVDMCPEEAKKQIQFVVYNKVWHEAKKENKFTHIIFLDIDEYWIPRHFNISIKQFLADFSDDDVISFEWLNDMGTLPKLSHVPRTISGNLSPLVKTIYPLHAPVKELRHHVPLFSKKVAHLLANKVDFRPRPSLIQAVSPELQSLKDAFIYHRAHRSAEEYVSLLLRGRPGDAFPYKTNRYGLPVKDDMHREIELPLDAFLKYEQSYVNFERKTNYFNHKLSAESFVEERYKASLANLAKHSLANYPLMMQMFRGVKLPEVTKTFKDVRKNLISFRPDDFRFIRDLAIDAASQNIDEAIELMEQARELNPTGSIILKKLDEFRALKGQ